MIRSHFYDLHLCKRNQYMLEGRFLANTNKSAAWTSKISNIIDAILIFYLRMKPRNTLINNMYLIFRIPTYHPSLLLQRITTGNRGLALLNSQFIHIRFISIMLQGLSLAFPSGILILNKFILLFRFYYFLSFYFSLRGRF